ncbi:hypothetical protein [Sagittula sp. SSi028]|uniref:hypothetical protein n=1 Tax=Sagittula sp. SSi028 TaxID=3400636 RepID=UPI003AF8681E
MYTYPRINTLLMVLLAILMTATVVIAIAAPDYFSDTFAAEDRLVEYGTSVFLLFGAIALTYRAVAGAPRAGLRFAILSGLYAALFFFASGEEISWGQRIFGLETTGIFLEHNDQQELTLHNMVVGGVKLDEVIFGNLLSVVLLSYLIVLPLLWSRAAWVRGLADWLAVPVPQKHHMVATLVTSIVIGVLTVSRKWEVYELAFALIALGIFINPRNPYFPTRKTPDVAHDALGHLAE